MKIRKDKTTTNSNFRVEYRNVEITRREKLLYCDLFKTGFKDLENLQLGIDLHIHEQTLSQNTNAGASVYADFEIDKTKKKEDNMSTNIQEDNYTQEEMAGAVPVGTYSDGSPRYYGNKEEKDITEINIGEQYVIEFKEAIINNNLKEVQYLIEIGVTPDTEILQFIAELEEKGNVIDSELKKEIEKHIENQLKTSSNNPNNINEEDYKALQSLANDMNNLKELNKNDISSELIQTFKLEKQLESYFHFQKKRNTSKDGEFNFSASAKDVSSNLQRILLEGGFLKKHLNYSDTNELELFSRKQLSSDTKKFKFIAELSNSKSAFSMDDQYWIDLGISHLRDKIEGLSVKDINGFDEIQFETFKVEEKEALLELKEALQPKLDDYKDILDDINTEITIDEKVNEFINNYWNYYEDDAPDVYYFNIQEPNKTWEETIQTPIVANSKEELNNKINEICNETNREVRVSDSKGYENECEIFSKNNVPNKKKNNRERDEEPNNEFDNWKEYVKNYQISSLADDYAMTVVMENGDIVGIQLPNEIAAKYIDGTDQERVEIKEEHLKPEVIDYLKYRAERKEINNIYGVRDEAIRRIENKGFNVETDFGGSIANIKNPHEFWAEVDFTNVPSVIEKEVWLCEEILNDIPFHELKHLPEDLSQDSLSLEYQKEIRENIEEELLNQINEKGFRIELEEGDFLVKISKDEKVEEYEIGFDKLPEEVEKEIQAIIDLHSNNHKLNPNIQIQNDVMDKRKLTTLSNNEDRVGANFKVEFPLYGKSKLQLITHLEKLQAGEKTDVIKGLEKDGKKFDAKLKLVPGKNDGEVNVEVYLDKKQEKSKNHKL